METKPDGTFAFKAQMFGGTGSNETVEAIRKTADFQASRSIKND